MNASEKKNYQKGLRVILSNDPMLNGKSSGEDGGELSSPRIVELEAKEALWGSGFRKMPSRPWRRPKRPSVCRLRTGGGRIALGVAIQKAP